MEASGVDALLTDLGNVLVRVVPSIFYRRIRDLVPGLEADTFDRKVLLGDAYRDFALGRIDGPAFAGRVGGVLGASFSYEAFREVWVDMFDDVPGNAEALRLAVEHVPVYILSNTDPVHVEHIRARYPWVDRASGTFLSCEEGLLKPDTRFFTRALERFGLEASRTVFIDDHAENVEAARSVGINAVLAHTPEDFGRLVRDLWG